MPAHNDDDDGKMTPFVSSTCFCCPRVPAEASSAREPAARRTIESSFQRTSNDDDASPRRYLTTENCKSAKARAAVARKRTLLRFYVQFFVFKILSDDKRKEKRELFPFPSVVVLGVRAKKANEAR